MTLFNSSAYLPNSRFHGFKLLETGRVIVSILSLDTSTVFFPSPARLNGGMLQIKAAKESVKQ
jgi:hypothetical protein